MPALFQLFRKGRLPDGHADRRLFADRIYATTQWRRPWPNRRPSSNGKQFDAAAWKKFAAAIHYQPGDLGQPDDFEALHKRLHELEGSTRGDARLLPGHGPAVLRRGGRAAGRLRPGRRSQRPAADRDRKAVRHRPRNRPAGSTRPCTACFAKTQVYRIDHYLGKETVQNILVLRFANTIFEPVWNRNYVDHVQITVAEEVTVGRRGDFYDETGVLRDMFQNHLLQLLMTTAMEAPVRFEAEAVRDEKVKVLQRDHAAVARGRGRRHAARPVSRLSRRAGRRGRQPDGHLRAS